MAVPLRIRRNPLVYPAGRALGFNPGHPLTKSGITRFSAIPAGANFVNLMQGGLPGAIVGAAHDSIRGGIGHAVDMTASGNSQFNWSGQSTANDLAGTMAAIFEWSSNNFPSVILLTSSAGAVGLGMCVGSGAQPNKFFFEEFNTGTRTVMSGFSFVANHSYFAALSFNPSTINYVVVDLFSGSSFVDTEAFGGTPLAPNGTYRVGGSGISPLTYQGPIMFSTAFLSIPELRQVAADPWSFWYPNDDAFNSLVGVSGGSAFTLSAAEGTYSLTGKSQILNSSRTISSSQGTYTLSGKNQAFAVALSTKPTSGVYTLTGEPQALNYTQFGITSPFGKKFIADTGPLTESKY